MDKGRLLAFTDGVVAIIVTIMVLELRVPEGHDLAALREVAPVFAAYVLSFVNVGIYWNNHHHLFQAVERVDGAVLWANLHLLFWLSLLPFVTAYMDESGFARPPVVLYVLDLLLCGVAYGLLILSLRRLHAPGTPFAQALGSGRKEIVSVLLYVAALAASLLWPPAALLLVAGVAALWFIPDRRFARVAGG